MPGISAAVPTYSFPAAFARVSSPGVAVAVELRVTVGLALIDELVVDALEEAGADETAEELTDEGLTDGLDFDELGTEVGEDWQAVTRIVVGCTEVLTMVLVAYLVVVLTLVTVTVLGFGGCGG